MQIRNYLAVVLSVLLFSLQNTIAQTAKTLTLAEAQTLAVSNSTRLKLSQNSLKTSEVATQLAKNDATPSIDVSLSASYIGNGLVTNRNFSNNQSVDMPHFGNNFVIEASQVVFAGVAISTSIQKAKLVEKVAQLNLYRSELDICFLVTGYYLDLYKLNNQAEIFRKNIEQTQLLIDQIKSRASQGMALSGDVIRHELMLQNMRLALIEAENNRKIINEQMLVTLGLPEGMEIVPDSSVLRLNPDYVMTENLKQQTLQNSPELKMASLNKEIATKELRMAKADYYPQLALFAANHFDGPILIEVPTIDKNFNYWYVGMGLRYNLSSLYRAGKKVRMANHNQSSATYSETLAMEQTHVEVYSAYTKFAESQEKLTVHETNLRLAEENYRIINNRYLGGLVLITEMLDASNTKLNAELQLVNAKLERIYNYYRLQREMGIKN